MHRMGSYFDPSMPNSTGGGGGGSLKGILSVPSSSTAPPTPPPTSSIPSKKRMAASIDGTGQQLAPLSFPRYGMSGGAAAAAGPSSGFSRSSLHSGSLVSSTSSRPVDRIKRAVRARHPRQLQFPNEDAYYDDAEETDMRHIAALNKRLASLTIADMSPRLVLQRVRVLFDGGDHREAAAFLRRVSMPTFRQVAGELPVDLFMDAMPHSLPILEAIYAKVHLGSTSGTLTMKGRLAFSPEQVVWHIVRFFACNDMHSGGANSLGVIVEMCGPWVSTCKRLLSVLQSADPRLRRVVSDRKRALCRAVEGLGQHGLVATSSSSALVNLHDALRTEFACTQKGYAEAVSKLDSANGSGGHKSSTSSNSSTSSVTSKSSSPPVAQSHQRQLSLRVEEIQERLIRNKTLLDVVEPTLERHRQPLEVLLGILRRRVDLDKEALFQFTQLRKDERLIKHSNAAAGGGGGSSKNPSVAPILMRFQRGCQQASLHR